MSSLPWPTAAGECVDETNAAREQCGGGSVCSNAWTRPEGAREVEGIVSSTVHAARRVR